MHPVAAPPSRSAPELPPPDSLKVAVRGLKTPHADTEKRKREALIEDIKTAFSNVKVSLERLYVGAKRERPPALETNLGAINEFYTILRFPLKLKDDLHKLRRWRNAGEHGITKDDDDGVRRVHPWVDRPQGPPVFPSRPEIKALVASINEGWLGRELEHLTADG